MIINYYKNLIVLALISFTFSSCVDDFLDRAPSAALDEDQVFGDIRLTKLYQHNLYSTLKSGWQNFPDANQPGKLGWEIISCCDDNCLSPYTWVSAVELISGQWMNRKENERWGSGYEVVKNWKDAYMSIRKINIFLTKHKETPLLTQTDRDDMDQMVAETKFLRAHHYFELIKRWGGVPIVDKMLLSSDNLRIPRSSYKECVEFIVKDCDEAAAVLPVTQTDYWIAKASKGAALALKAKVLLYAASPYWSAQTGVTWKQAADAAKEVIDLNTYTLYPNWREQFFTPFNSEVIWSKNVGYVDWWGLTMHIMKGFGGWESGSLLATQDMVDMYEVKSSGLLPKDDPNFNPQNPYVDRDPRFYSSILYNGAKWRNTTIEFFEGGKQGPSSGTYYTGYYIIKHFSEAIDYLGGTGNMNINWSYIRYTDILLSYAEAINHVSGPAEALPYVDMVRDRVGLKRLPRNISQQELNDRIINERAIEFLAEDQRWFDMRRLGLAERFGEPVHKVTAVKNTNGTFTYTYGQETGPTRKKYDNKDQYYLYPIFIEEINKNTSLVQNPGWTDIIRNN